MRSMLREQASLRPNARTLWEIQEKALHVPVETATNLYTEILSRAEEDLQAGRERRSQVRDKASLAACQQENRRIFDQCVGGLLPETAPVLSQVTARADHPSFTVETLLLSPGEGTLLTAALYLPRLHGPGPHPAVLLLIGHTDQGKADPEYQYLAQLLAYAGFAVLALDPLGEGERFEHYESDLSLQPIQGCSGEHDLMDAKCKLLGISLARYFIRDSLAALHYLRSRPEVDPARIALTGHSGGGTQVCMLMLAAGERFACAAPCAYVTDTRAMLEIGVDPDNEMVWPGSLKAGLDYIDCLMGVAPRPLLILSPRQDFFPREGAQRAWQEAQSIWRAAGAETLPDLVTAPTEHAYSPILAQAATHFFSRHLLGKDPDFSGFSFVSLPDSALAAVPGRMLLDAYPDMRTLQAELSALLSSRPLPPDAAARQAALRGLICADRVSPGEPRVHGEGICGHYVWRTVVWRPEPTRWSSGVFLRDMRRGDGPLPTVLAIWPGGLSRLAEHSPWIHRATARGFQVLVMDTAAEGALLPRELGTSGMYIGWGTLYKLQAYLMQLGDSLCALRTRDVLAAVHMLRSWPEADPNYLCMYALGDHSRYAQLASLLTGVPVSADNLCQPWEDIVTAKYHDQTHTWAWLCPGILACTNTKTLISDLTARGLTIRDPVEEAAASDISIL